MQVHLASWLQLQQRLMCSTHSLSVSSQYTSPRPLCLGRPKVAEGRAMQMSQRLFERTWVIEDFSLLYLNYCASWRKLLTSEKLHLLTREWKSASKYRCAMLYRQSKVCLYSLSVSVFAIALITFYDIVFVGWIGAILQQALCLT